MAKICYMPDQFCKIPMSHYVRDFLLNLIAHSDKKTVLPYFVNLMKFDTGNRQTFLG